MSTTPEGALPADSGTPPRNDLSAGFARVLRDLSAGRVLARVMVAADALALAFEVLRAPLGIAASVASTVEDAWGALLVVGGVALLVMLVWRGRALFGMVLRPRRLLVHLYLGFVFFLLVQSGLSVVSDVVTGRARGASPQHWNRVLERLGTPGIPAPQPGRSSVLFGRAALVGSGLWVLLAIASGVAPYALLNDGLAAIAVVETLLIAAMVADCVARGWPRLRPRPRALERSEERWLVTGL